MLQCYSLKSSYPRLLPQSPKVCSLHLCLFCYPACQIITTKFLNSYICTNIQYLSFSFWLSSLCIIGSNFIHLIRTASNVFLFIAECLSPWASQVVLVIKTPPDNAGDIRDPGSIPGLGRSPGEVHGNPLQYSCLENPVDRGAWQATVRS